MRNIFLTGATGFIGSHFIKHALSKGHNIKALIRDKKKVPESTTSKVIWEYGDLNDLNEKMFEDCDTLVHLASSGVSPKKAEFEEMLFSNVIGTSKLIKVAAKSKIDRIIIAGTCHEYGKLNTYKPIKVDTQLNPISIYGATKAASYCLSVALCKKYNLKMFYGRIFSAYGEGQFEENFWPSLQKAALDGSDFPMTSGQQIRDFINVELVIENLLNGCTREDLKKGNIHVKNIGSGKKMKLIDFAKSEWKRLGAKGVLIPGDIPTRIDEPKYFVPDLREEIF